MNTNTKELNLDKMEMVTGGDLFEEIVVNRFGGFALGAVAGGSAGMIVGSAIGPVGTTVGGVVGFAAGGVAGAIVGADKIAHAVGNGAAYAYEKFKDLVDWIG